MQEPRINHKITAATVRVITFEHTQLGVLPLAQARELASKYNTDLIEISPTAIPPVCMLVDYGKYKYEQEKRNKHETVVKVKEVSLTIRIAENDLQTKLRQVEEFLKKNLPVKIEIKLFGRDKDFKPRAISMANDIVKRLVNISVNQPIKTQGNSISVMLNPKKA